MNIGKKIVAGFAILFLLLAIPATYSVLSGLRIQKNSNSLQNKIYPALDLTKKLIDTNRRTKEALLAAITDLDEEAIDHARGSAKEFQQMLSELTKVTNDRELEDIGTLYDEYFRDGVLIAEALVEGGDMSTVMDEVASLNITANRLFTLLKEYHDRNYKVFVDSVGEVNGLSNKFVTIALGGLLVSLILGVIIAYFISTRITNGINVVVERIEDIAQGEGDLTRRLEMTSNDEMGLLANGFNTFVGNLRGIIARVSSFAKEVASASMQFSSTCEEIKDRIKGQMTRTEQMATATEEMSATIAEVARNCSDAAQTAMEADSTASKGSDVIARTIKGINDIASRVQESTELILLLNKRSGEIGKIVGVIDDIADQTNLLALNAAIEAARAGEQGRGFAVVADEVRKLSERTIGATKEIGNMISTIQVEAQKAVNSMESCNEEGNIQKKLAGEAGDVLKGIVSKVRQVNDMIQRIATATEEQSKTSEQIGSDMEEIAFAFKETTDGTEQMSLASNNLSVVAAQLQKLTSKFKVDVEEHHEERGQKEETAPDNKKHLKIAL